MDDVTALDDMVERLRAAGETTRCRVLALLRSGELSVGEIALILGQSQPRLSRHMKFLTNAGLVERMPEGAWVFFRLSREPIGQALNTAMLALIDPDDPVIARDRARLEEVKATRRRAAQAYFEGVAPDWDAIRAMHYPEDAIEAAIQDAAGPGPFEFVVDVGTGTGRILSLFAGRSDRVEGIDLSHQMLNMARANLAGAGFNNVAVRHGDATAAPFAADVADLVIIHQVLHFLDEPGRAIEEAARLLRPGGRLVVVDFAPHEMEQLRREQSHRHLGFSNEDIAHWFTFAGLTSGAIQTFDPPEAAEQGLAVSIWTASLEKSLQNRSVLA